MYLPFVRENCASLRPPQAANIRSAPFPLPLRREPACAGLRVGWEDRIFCFLRLKCFPQCCFISAIFPDRALCCLAYYICISLFSFQGANRQKKLRSSSSFASEGHPIRSVSSSSQFQSIRFEIAGGTKACTLKIEQCKNLQKPCYDFWMN